MCTIRSRSRERERSPSKPEETHPSSSSDCPPSIRRAAEQWWWRVETATAGGPPPPPAAAAFGARSERLRGGDEEDEGGAELRLRPASARRCEMIGLARHGTARRDGRRMEATDGGWSRPGWHPSPPPPRGGPRVRSRSTTTPAAVLRRVATRHRAAPAPGLPCAPTALQSPSSSPL